MATSNITRRAASGLALAAFITRAVTAQTGSQSEERPVGRVTLSQTQVSLFGSVSWGHGTLTFDGRSYRFRIRGLGIGGIGISELHATGEVYRLSRLADFPGLYGGARTGAVAGSSAVQGGLWLENPAGVMISLHPERSGYALQVGADGLLIQMD
ncbi:MAG: hypothetical protein O9313_18090 [Acetobacteraceae bacterium]|jgi:hypothetical protein|nr:hypothetical protein [Acetobacteraceae bacterium]